MDDFIDDDGFDDGDAFDDEPDGDMGNADGLNEDMPDGSKDNDTFDIGWEEVAMFGALSEEIADDERERLRIEREMDKDKDQENM